MKEQSDKQQNFDQSVEQSASRVENDVSHVDSEQSESTFSNASNNCEASGETYVDGNEEVFCEASSVGGAGTTMRDIAPEASCGNGKAANTTSGGSLSPGRRLLDKILTLFLIAAISGLALALVLKLFVVQRILIDGESMMPNFQNGQYVWINKLASPGRGDVVVLYPNGTPTFWEELTGDSGSGGIAEKYIKRVVALSGDKLWTEKQSDGNYILVVETPEGEILCEDYYTVNGASAKFYDAESLDTRQYCYIPVMSLSSLGEDLASATREAPYVVPEDCFYAMGDNRFHSTDSRVKGAMKYTQIMGVLM